MTRFAVQVCHRPGFSGVTLNLDDHHVDASGRDLHSVASGLLSIVAAKSFAESGRILKIQLSDPVVRCRRPIRSTSHFAQSDLCYVWDSRRKRSVLFLIEAFELFGVFGLLVCHDQFQHRTALQLS